MQLLYEIPKIDLYTLLGIKATATAQDIKKALKRQMLRFHPDKAIHELLGYATAITKQLAEAKEWLIDNLNKKLVYYIFYGKLDFEPSEIDQFREAFPGLEDTSMRSFKKARALEEIAAESTTTHNPYQAHLNFLKSEKSRTIDYAA